VYSGPNVIYEKNEDTNQEALHVYGPTGRISKTVSGLTDYYHTDHLGSTRLVTDESGTIITHAEYYPFGESLNEEEYYLYMGKEKDSTGLYYYGARYYDPETGRFLTRDPTEETFQYDWLVRLVEDYKGKICMMEDKRYKRTKFQLIIPF
jgi:RHS repeat-associated protein